MPKMLLEGKLARALSALGGRNLPKTAELLAGNLAELMPGSEVRSDGRLATLQKGKQAIAIASKQGKPVFRGKYYVYQRGDIVLRGEQKALEDLKALLAKLASQRRQYLLARYSTEELSEYGLDTDFVIGLEKQVEALEVS